MFEALHFLFLIFTTPLDEYVDQVKSTYDICEYCETHCTEKPAVIDFETL